MKRTDRGAEFPIQFMCLFVPRMEHLNVKLVHCCIRTDS